MNASLTIQDAMSDPYRTVLISLITSAILCIGILFYLYVYPKKKINYFFLLLLIMIPPITSLLRPGTYESGDFNIHIYRIMSFYDTLKEGIFMPSWAAELNATYGNPLFIFNYSLPYYFVSLLHFLGLSFISSMKAYLGIVFILSGIFMYKWIRILTKNELAAFTAAIFYLFNPYHLIDIHFRATLGESTVFALAPLLLLCITQYFETKKNYMLLLISLSTGLLILGHPLLAIAVLVIIFIYSILLANAKKSHRHLLKVLLFIAMGMLSSIYLWVPFLLYSGYMYPNPSLQLTFNPFHQLFFSPWIYGFLFQGHYGELALMVGYTQLLVVFASIYFLLKRKASKTRAFHIMWLLIFFLLLFLMHPISTFIWNHFPIFWMFIPTGRLLLPTAICTSVIAGYLVLIWGRTKKQKFIIYALLFLTAATTILNWGHRTVLPEIDDNDLRKGVWKSTVVEGITAYFLNNKWADKDNFWFSELPSQPIEIIQGQAKVKPLERDSIRHTYVINAQTPITIKENTLYFPGWSLKSNTNEIALYPGERGVIQAKLPKGLQYVELKYDDWLIYKISKIISFTIFLVIIFLLLLTLIFNTFMKSLLKYFTSNPKHFTR